MSYNTPALSLFNNAVDAEANGDASLAVELYERAAKLQFGSAMINLGNLYDEQGSVFDPEKAVYWYKKAYQAGYSAGANNLSVHYRLAGNEKLRLYWLNKAAEMGETDAVAELRKIGQ